MEQEPQLTREEGRHMAGSASLGVDSDGRPLSATEHHAL